MHSTADEFLFSRTSADKLVEELGVPNPQNRLIDIFFKEAGPTYPKSFVLRYGDEVTKDIFNVCKLPYYAGKYYQRIIDGENEVSVELKSVAKEEAESIWKTAMLSISNYLEIKDIKISHLS